MKEKLLETLVYVLPTLLSVLTGYIILWLRKKQQWLIEKANLDANEQEALECIMEGMAKAQDEFVRQAKAASEDRRLSADEVQKAKDIAYTHAVAVAKGPAKDLILDWGKTRVDSLIKQALSNFKTK